MKKVLLFLILASMFNILQAQVFKEENEYTKTTRALQSLGELDLYSPKVLPVDKETHIALATSISNRSVFVLLQNGSTEMAKQVVLDTCFNVKDFAIYDGMLYFCGNMSNDSTTEAFIAYTSVSQMFPTSGSSGSTPRNIKYTRINNIPQDNIYSIDRIEAYYNSDSNEVVLAGIGKMRYGKPPYLRFNHDYSDGELELVDPIEYDLDFFMLYTIKEQLEKTNYYASCLGATPVYDTANHLELFYVPTDTIGGCYFNKFADITQTDNKIYLTSVNYGNSYVNWYLHSRYIDVISFDKLTHQQQTGRITFPFNIHQEYGVKTTALRNDEIAIACAKCDETIPAVECCALKISAFDSNSFVLSHISIFDSVYGKPHILDCEYLDTTNELLVLKESKLGNIDEDIVFHINLDDDVNYPYDSYKYWVVNTEEDRLFKWNDLQSSNAYNYTVFGCKANKELSCHDRRFDALYNQTSCFKSDKFTIETSNRFTIFSIPNLEQCEFSIVTPNIINGGQLFEFYSSTPIYNIFIENIPIKMVRKSTLTTECVE